MNAEEIKQEGIQKIEELEKNYQKLTDCLAEFSQGDQSVEYLDAIYETVKEDAVELNKLSTEYRKLTEGTDQ